MRLIREIEVAYFRSFYKVNLNNCSDLNVVFGKNDVGKSNLVRALNLFFNQETDPSTVFDFDIDFSDNRRIEAEESPDVRKFIYVKITFNTPSNYRKSLGESFYVKRQWTVSRGEEFVEEVSSSIKPNQRHIVTRFLNLISFTYIPAIKDIRIFEFLLGKIYDSIALSEEFSESIAGFAAQVQDITSNMFSGLPSELAFETKISSPRRMDELFETLDFETKSSENGSVKSLTLQRGDGIKVRHIPELLKFIAERGRHHYHIWGFEEPENSLDFVSAEAEASRISKMSSESNIQLFVTTHSPSFYNLDGDHVKKYYVNRDYTSGAGVVIQGRALDKVDINTAIGEGFYLPAVAAALQKYSEQQAVLVNLTSQLEGLREKISSSTRPVVLTEGKTDVLLLEEAWRRLRKGEMPYTIQSCDTTDGSDGGAAGAGKLALCLKAIRHDSPQVVVGVFDRDAEGIKGFVLDANFQESSLSEGLKSQKHGKAHGLLLPIPDFRTEFAEAQNLSTEFLFPDEALNTKVGSRGLVLKYQDILWSVGKKEVRLSGEEYPWNVKIDGGKKDFSEIVVSSLDDSMFLEFEKIFSILDKILV